MRKGIDRIIIETIVKQSIQGFRNDPHREIRKLVDLGASMVTGKAQKSFFEFAQNKLTQDSSPYYQIVSQIVRNFPAETIQHFFINLGYNSWTKGARTIRLMEAERGHQIPWALIFQSTTRKLYGEKLLRILEEARALGIYTFFFFTGDAFPVSDVLNLAQQFTDCVFILLTSSEENENRSIAAWAEATNCLFLFRSQQMDAQTENILSACRKSGVLFGLWMNYDAENISSIQNGELTERAEEQGSTVLVFVQGKHCDEETAKITEDYVRGEHLDPKHAVFVVDLYSDVIQVDKNISNGKSVASILSSGTLTLSQSSATADLCMDTLISGLRQVATASYPHLM